MWSRFTFFTSEDLKLEVKKELDFEGLLKEITKPLDIKDIDPDNKLYAEVNIRMTIPGWQLFDSFPRWRLLEILTYLKDKSENGNSSSLVEAGIISSLNRVFPSD